MVGGCKLGQGLRPVTKPVKQRRLRDAGNEGQNASRSFSFCFSAARPQPYDPSAAIRKQFTMPARPRIKNPYDGTADNSTMLEKFVITSQPLPLEFGTN